MTCPQADLIKAATDMERSMLAKLNMPAVQRPRSPEDLQVRAGPAPT